MEIYRRTSIDLRLLWVLNIFQGMANETGARYGSPRAEKYIKFQ